MLPGKDQFYGITSRSDSGVDKGLVAAFLRMSPEERLKANDNAVRAIMELRCAFKQSGAATGDEPERDS